MGNPVFRGDLRARVGSRKILAIEVFSLGVLGVLTFLGLPPELAKVDVPQPAGLTAALLIVQSVLITYFASACAIGEIAVEGEKPAVDLSFAPFAPATIVTGKSQASLLTILSWLLLGAPLVIFAARIRQEPVGGIIAVTVFIAVAAWAIAQIGILYSVLFESEFSRMLAHWGTLLVIFVGTLALPPPLRLVNPIGIAAHPAEMGTLWFACAAYGAVGVLADSMAAVALRRFASA